MYILHSLQWCIYLPEKPLHRYISISLILTGVVLIVVVALMAFQSFYGYRIPEFTGTTLEESISRLVYALVDIATRLGFLGVVVWASGILLKYGIQLLRETTPPGKT